MFISQLHTDTIVALCTPQGSGALALIRISGDQAFTVADALAKLASGKTLAEQPTHTIQYGSVCESSGTIIDHVLFLLMRAPKTFTGADTVEITCHNNPFIIEAIIQQALTHGARLAQPGEFTKQAVLNNKMDLVQAEALNELIHANTTLGLKKALAQLDGTLSAELATIEKNLLTALTYSEASFEFLDEEVTLDTQINAHLAAIARTIATIKTNFEQQQQIRQGIRIALIGSVNAGKSSLFNALLKKERAIVTAIAGTTRDTIEAGIYRYGTYLTLVDTAGLRITNDSIEQEGIKRSWQEAALADIVLLVHDASQPQSAQEAAWYEDIIHTHGTKIIQVHNKCDLINSQTYKDPMLSADITVSCTQKTGLAVLEKILENKITALFTRDGAPFLLNKRQFSLVLTLEQHLATITTMINNKPIQYELLSHHLTEALASCAEITGKTIQEQMFNEVFSTFCIGK